MALPRVPVYLWHVIPVFTSLPLCSDSLEQVIAAAVIAKVEINAILCSVNL